MAYLSMTQNSVQIMTQTTEGKTDQSLCSLHALHVTERTFLLHVHMDVISFECSKNTMT